MTGASGPDDAGRLASGQQDPGGAGEVFRAVSVNLLDGGLDPDSGAARRDQSAAALRDWQPHLVLIQELCAPGEDTVRMHFRSLANAAGMEPAALGPPRGSRRQRCGILADTSAVEVLDDGPPPGIDAPFWAEAVIRIRDTGTELAVTSVHAPETGKEPAVPQQPGMSRARRPDSRKEPR
jgi:hypothetical protein